MHAEYLILKLSYIDAIGDMKEIGSNSGVPLSFMLTFDKNVQQKTFKFNVTDDHFALEDPEVIMLSISSLSTHCNIIPSIGQMQITILDIDGTIHAPFV